jgi:DNA-binding response OmpR family regulator
VIADCGAFDLLITDFRMPRLDGLGLVKQSRLAGYRGKVIIFSSALSDGDRERFGNLSVDAMIEKPSRLEELIAVVERLKETRETNFCIVTRVQQRFCQGKDFSGGVLGSRRSRRRDTAVAEQSIDDSSRTAGSDAGLKDES